MLLRMERDLLDAFFDRHKLWKGPFLLGYSGGPDSKALLLALLKRHQKFPLNLHLVHIDHGWRPESAQEASFLQEEAASLGLPFHMIRQDPSCLSKGNLEAAARESRLTFFRQIYEEVQAQGLFLVHHR